MKKMVYFWNATGGGGGAGPNCPPYIYATGCCKQFPNSVVRISVRNCELHHKLTFPASSGWPFTHRWHNHHKPSYTNRHVYILRHVLVYIHMSGTICICLYIITACVYIKTWKNYFKHIMIYIIICRIVSAESGTAESTIDSEGFKGGTRGAPIMPRDAVSRTANVERTGRH